MSRLTDMMAKFADAPEAERATLVGALAHDGLAPVADSLRAAEGCVLALADDGQAERIVAHLNAHGSYRNDGL